MLRRFWLLFAQVATVCVAALFVVATLRPDLLARFAGKNNVVLVQETPLTVPAPKIASLADAAKKAMPSVVNIYTSKEVRHRQPLADDPILRRFFPGLEENEPRRATSLGSGVIVSSEGYVLTNNHVVEEADDIELVLADGRRMRASVRGSDPESDLAVLKVDGKNLPVITFGQLENVQVGDTVLAIGSPFGFGSSVTHGIVSALGRSHLGINRFEDFIQTDAAVNPGNSGGALVDSSGNLVGINSAIFSQSGGSQGIGFAIPVSLAKNVLEQIIKDGEVTRGWLGIEPQDITPELATAFALSKSDGVLIRGVLKSGPADRAGMQVRDVVINIDGKPTHDVASLLAQIAALTPGSQARLQVMREQKQVDIDVIVGKRPKPRVS
ncbi:MAG TPA: trypsin-like peptidase domain-containing protein [Casimicrobiaceae bacterium]|jgi:serine protease DegQ|nr:trypsin-like peptidase domain-containing protein [Casimicrobiaceae bacterium]